ncbi:MAG: FAD-binding oxidoreductase [Hyphomicrobiales bacterium]|nr:FAD-binding oxidoreductase [Hyphomicrobiales bacterium]MCP4998260.1 FAD-binding oxidoreductase [Hyphomicrobiales bacterium]
MTGRAEAFDFIVIGAGMAGASAAAEFAREARVLLVETESQPGYHTTGRSAALFTRAYGPPAIRALTRASETFFNDPQSEYLDHPLLRKRGAMFVSSADQAGALTSLQKELGDAVLPLAADGALEQVPLLRREYVAKALLDDSAADIDVAALHQHYLKTFRAAGGEMRTASGVGALTHDGSCWQVDTSQSRFSGPVVVNAAGAWADVVAQMAGVAPVGLVPKRRTALLVPPPENCETRHWPMVVDVEERFYMKPDAGKLLISPADETPSPPCDAQPDEMDVAICVDRIETAFDFQVRRIDHKWAGLRSFVADRCPVVGFDGDVPGFFWLAGQGGYGIQSAPALARMAAALALGRAVPKDIRDEGVNEADLSSRRERLAA